MKPIYLLCPLNIRTGGPEAIHQLSDALIEQGFDARMVYFEWPQTATLEQAATQDAYNFGARLNTIEDYAHYKVNSESVIPNSADAIVVLPESICHLAPKFDKATVLIWWLSVDNAFAALSKVNLNYLRMPKVKHAAQSDYAADVLRALCFASVGRCGRLTDYTTGLRLPTIFAIHRPMRVAIQATPHKVVAPIDEIATILENAGIECVFIGRELMSRDQIAQLFETSRVYLDLGNMPGKDRMPREARAMGCEVVVAAETLWHEPEVVASEVIRRARSPICTNYMAERTILTEKTTFFEEVCDVFNDL